MAEVGYEKYRVRTPLREAGGIVTSLMEFKSELDPVITEFMEAGVAKDINRAYAFVPTGAKREDILACLQDLVTNSINSICLNPMIKLHHGARSNQSNSPRLWQRSPV